jgi:ribosome maturation factor RimP
LLIGTEDKEVVLRVGEEETLFPYEMIDRANVVPEI